MVVQTFCARQKYDFAFSKIGFCAGTKGFEDALNAVKFLVCHKTVFGRAPNIFGPVEGQGISLFYPSAKKLVMCLLCHHVYLILMWRLECLI